MDEGLSRRHGETVACQRGCAYGSVVVVYAKIRFGKRDGLLNCEGLSSALCHWVCSAVHFQSKQSWVDHSGLPLHGLFFCYVSFL